MDAAVLRGMLASRRRSWRTRRRGRSAPLGASGSRFAFVRFDFDLSWLTCAVLERSSALDPGRRALNLNLPSLSTKRNPATCKEHCTKLCMTAIRKEIRMRKARSAPSFRDAGGWCQYAAECFSVEKHVVEGSLLSPSAIPGQAQ